MTTSECISDQLSMFDILETGNYPDKPRYHFRQPVEILNPLKDLNSGITIFPQRGRVLGRIKRSTAMVLIQVRNVAYQKMNWYVHFQRLRHYHYQIKERAYGAQEEHITRNSLLGIFMDTFCAARHDYLLEIRPC